MCDTSLPLFYISVASGRAARLRTSPTCAVRSSDTRENTVWNPSSLQEAQAESGSAMFNQNPISCRCTKLAMIKGLADTRQENNGLVGSQH